MKILHVVASLQAASGGPALSVSRTATEQARLGHDVVIVAFDERHLGKPLPTDGVKRVLVSADYFSVRGRGWSPKFRRVVMEETKNADIVHNHGLWMWSNAYARDAAIAAAKPLVISPRGMLEAWSLNRSKLRKAVAWWLFERKNLQSAVMFHATAESEAESIRDAMETLRDNKTKGLKDEESKRLRQQGGRAGTEESETPIVVAPNGVDLPDLENRPGRELLEGKFPQLRGRRWVVFMSRLHPKKGIDVLLRAWKKQKEVAAGQWREARAERDQGKISDPILILAGPDLIGYRKNVERMVREMNLADSVAITGDVQGEAKGCLLANAEVFVLPSYSENFGIVVAEAMAWARPVIVSTGAPWRDVEEVGAGWWVKPEQSDLTEALGEALGAGEVRLAATGAKGRALVAKNYSWSQAGEKLAAAYATLVDI